MGEISIKVTIADRVYPLKVNEEEEELVRLAAKKVGDRIKSYQESYAVRDKQDLLSMSVLHYAMQTLKIENQYSSSQNSVKGDLLDLDNMLTDFLSKV